MSTIINDFICCAVKKCGFGHFENDELAVSYARTMGKHQQRKFKRHGIVPAAFMAYLKRIRAIPEDVWLPEKKRTVQALIDLIGEAREVLLPEMFPELRNTMGSSQCVWQALEREGKLHRLEGPGGTAKMPDYLQESKHI